MDFQPTPSPLAIQTWLKHYIGPRRGHRTATTLWLYKSRIFPWFLGTFQYPVCVDPRRKSRSVINTEPYRWVDLMWSIRVPSYSGGSRPHMQLISLHWCYSRVEHGGGVCIIPFTQTRGSNREYDKALTVRQRANWSALLSFDQPATCANSLNWVCPHCHCCLYLESIFVYIWVHPLAPIVLNQHVSSNSLGILFNVG